MPDTQIDTSPLARLADALTDDTLFAFREALRALAQRRPPTDSAENETAIAAVVTDILNTRDSVRRDGNALEEAVDEARSCASSAEEYSDESSASARNAEQYASSAEEARDQAEEARYQANEALEHTRACEARTTRLAEQADEAFAQAVDARADVSLEMAHLRADLSRAIAARDELVEALDRLEDFRMSEADAARVMQLLPLIPKNNELLRTLQLVSDMKNLLDEFRALGEAMARFSNAEPPEMAERIRVALVDAL